MTSPGRPLCTSTKLADTRTESVPDRSIRPVIARPAPSCRARSAGVAPASRPRCTISVGDTVRSGPAPSKFCARTSTIPSRQTSSAGSSTVKGSTAMRLSSSGAAGCDRMLHVTTPRTTRILASAAAAAIALIRLGRGADGDALAARTSRNSAAEANRLSGSLASALVMASLTWRGTSGRTCIRGVSALVNCAAAIACGVAPTKGDFPASIS